MILVVEDEMLVRIDAVDVLQAHGYAILEAANSYEALRLIEDRPEVWTLFTDIDMPGRMNGLALAHEVCRRYPAAHILLTSGKVFPVEGAMPPRGQFIGKPYCIDDVSVTIDELYEQDNKPVDTTPLAA